MSDEGVLDSWIATTGLLCAPVDVMKLSEVCCIVAHHLWTRHVTSFIFFIFFFHITIAQVGCSKIGKEGTGLRIRTDSQGSELWQVSNP